MKVRVILIAFFMSLFSIFSLAAQPAANMPQSNKVDGQVEELIMVIDGYEVAAAKVALQKTSNPNVKQFAQQMIKDHSKNLQDATVLARKLKIAPLASSKSNDLQKDGKDELTKLKSLQGKDFDKEYINNMVQGHEDALSLIDNSSPNISNAQLKQFLAATRVVVAHHLQMAKDTQKMLNS